jgi:hypothetical protein
MKVEVGFVYEKNLREYIVGNDVNGKFLVNWSEPITFQTLRPLDELEALDSNCQVMMKRIISPFLTNSCNIHPLPPW